MQPTIAQIKQAEPRVTIAQIQRAVAEHFVVPLQVMSARTRAHRSVRPRQIAMYLAFRHVPVSMNALGKKFGNADRTSVHNAVDVVDKLRRTNSYCAEFDQYYGDAIDEITMILKLEVLKSQLTA